MLSVTEGIHMYIQMHVVQAHTCDIRSPLQYVLQIYKHNSRINEMCVIRCRYLYLFLFLFIYFVVVTLIVTLVLRRHFRTIKHACVCICRMSICVWMAFFSFLLSACACVFLFCSKMTAITANNWYCPIRLFSFEILVLLWCTLWTYYMCSRYVYI